MANILHIPNQHPFLVQERTDPITGDRIEAGDEIVICAACKSAFLKSSWEYIGGQHCGQSLTLSALPEEKKLELIRLPGEKIFEVQESRWVEAKSFSEQIAFVGTAAIAVLSAILGIYIGEASIGPLVLFSGVAVFVGNLVYHQVIKNRADVAAVHQLGMSFNNGKKRMFFDRAFKMQLIVFTGDSLPEKPEDSFGMTKLMTHLYVNFTDDQQRRQSIRLQLLTDKRRKLYDLLFEQVKENILEIVSDGSDEKFLIEKTRGSGIHIRFVNPSLQQLEIVLKNQDF